MNNNIDQMRSMWHIVEKPNSKNGGLNDERERKVT
jgi:hypothetical protein